MTVLLFAIRSGNRVLVWNNVEFFSHDGCKCLVRRAISDFRGLIPNVTYNKTHNATAL